MYIHRKLVVFTDEPFEASNMMGIASPVVARSPSFGSYSSAPTHRLERIAARVISELHDVADDELFIEVNPPKIAPDVAGDGINYDSGSDELEFTFVCRDPAASPISADELFSDGKIRPFFPFFNSDLVFHASDGSSETRHATVRLPLRKLMSQEDEAGAGESMPEPGDELEGIPDGTYCVWTPRPQSPERCEKSKSTGSSRRWRFRDLLGRSSSDGKDTFIFLSPAATGRKISKPADDPKVNNAAPRPISPAEKALPAKGGGVPAIYAKKEDDRRRSYLPNRQEIVGFFANVNGLTRSH